MPGFSGDGGQASKAEFNYIMCITLNPKGDKLHIADLKNRRIREMDLNSGIVKTIAGNGNRGIPKNGTMATESPLVDPRAVCSDEAGNVYVLKRGGHAQRVIRPDGKNLNRCGQRKQRERRWRWFSSAIQRAETHLHRPRRKRLCG